MSDSDLQNLSYPQRRILHFGREQIPWIPDDEREQQIAHVLENPLAWRADALRTECEASFATMIQVRTGGQR